MTPRPLLPHFLLRALRAQARYACRRATRAGALRAHDTHLCELSDNHSSSATDPYADRMARPFSPPSNAAFSMASVSVPVSVNEDQVKAMAKKAGAAALDVGKKAPCHSSVHLRCALHRTLSHCIVHRAAHTVHCIVVCTTPCTTSHMLQPHRARPRSMASGARHREDRG